MAEQQDITETVRQIVENSELLDASVLEHLPQLRAAKKLVFSLAEVTAMREALRTEKVLTVAELHRIIAETKRMEDEAAKAAELDGSLLIGGIYLFDQEAPLDLSTSRNERPEAVLDYEDLSDDEPEAGLEIDDNLNSGSTIHQTEN
ncbi:hypothetical protein AAVH_22843 [Aphelenchoides avenae]|nr:hypothetical protein AAVH_22843 [Aphelenchus avenae]